LPACAPRPSSSRLGRPSLAASLTAAELPLGASVLTVPEDELELEELEAPELPLEFADEIEAFPATPALSLAPPPQPHSNRQAAAAAAPSSGKRGDDGISSVRYPDIGRH
jgi:hypothetical protein